MTANIILGRASGQVAGGRKVTQAEIDYRCVCTWRIAKYEKNGKSLWHLSYKNMMCPAPNRFHEWAEEPGE